MMDDLISRQALRDAMYHEAFETDSDMQKWDSGCWIRYKMFENVVEALPPAQPERKKGKWIVHPEVKNVYGGTYIECSQCGEKYVVQHMEDEKYCRNCGAKMEREQKHLGNKSDLVLLDEVKYE